MAPSILCISSSLTTTLLWNKEGGLPFDVTVSNAYAITGHAIKLDWKKKMHFTDSGTYVCRATSSNGTIMVLGIDLTVLRK